MRTRLCTKSLKRGTYSIYQENLEVSGNCESNTYTHKKIAKTIRPQKYQLPTQTYCKLSPHTLSQQLPCICVKSIALCIIHHNHISHLSCPICTAPSHPMISHPIASHPAQIHPKEEQIPSQKVKSHAYSPNPHISPLYATSTSLSTPHIRSIQPSIVTFVLVNRCRDRGQEV